MTRRVGRDDVVVVDVEEERARPGRMEGGNGERLRYRFYTWSAAALPIF